MTGWTAASLRSSSARTWCASSSSHRNVWINDKTVHELGNEHDPIGAAQDGTMDFTVPKTSRSARRTKRSRRPRR